MRHRSRRSCAEPYSADYRWPWLGWLRSGITDQNMAELEVHVVRIQAVWRGFAQRRRLPVVIAAMYAQLLVGAVLSGLGQKQRQLAKALIAVRNQRVRLLREEIRRVSQANSFGSLLFTGEQMAELHNHLSNPKHRLRAALITQAWWRGCRVRGWKGRFGGPHRRKDEDFQHSSRDRHDALASFLDGPSRTLHIPRRVYIFFSDTGGGHRASALALEAALRHQYGEQVRVSLVDFIREATPWPWNQAAEGYQVLGQYPWAYRLVYEHEQGNRSWRETKTFQMIWYSCAQQINQFLDGLLKSGVDIIISVHPLIHHLVLEAWRDVVRPVSVVTVVTDLGSAHLSWFDPRVDMIFVPSVEIQKLAMHHGVSPKKIHLCGLPVREGFWHARPVCPEGEDQLRQQLGLAAVGPPKVVLMMGGGEGFGNIVQVAISIGNTLARVGRGRLIVICGRNEDVRNSLEQYPWKAGPDGAQVTPPTILGFVSNVDEYMSVADCLVTKAGPGSIAEAMIKGLPCLLTSFVPGQEEGNIKFVTSNGAGEYVPDTEPERVAETIAGWLGDPESLTRMSLCAQNLARPSAALDITRRICDDLLDLGQELQEPCPGTGENWSGEEDEDC